MNDLELLKDVPGHLDPPDAVTRDRIRASMEARISAGRRRRRRPTVRGGLVAIAAVLCVGVAAAAVMHRWTDRNPVGIPLRSPDADSNFGGEISDPNGAITSADQLASVVTEFGPSIRLPEGGSFDEWQRHIDGHLSAGQEFARSEVALDMVLVSQCQWAQRWLDATAGGAQTQAAQATTVLGGVNDWLRGAGLDDNGQMAGLLQQMGAGDGSGIQLWENGRCAYMGAWGATTAVQDGKATGDLTPAIAATRSYLSGGGDPAAFDPTAAGHVDPNVFWTWGHMQPVPAEPGAIFIAPSDGTGVTLVSVSESGTQFCAVVTGDDVIRGTTTADLSVVPDGDGAAPATPGPLTCTPGGW
jgi:hypothetical protein